MFEDRLRIRIEDDGGGFESGRTPAGDRKGLGLIGIRERASHLKGSVIIESAPDRGTRIEVELPARRRAEPKEDDVLDGAFTHTRS